MPLPLAVLTGQTLEYSPVELHDSADYKREAYHRNMYSRTHTRLYHKAVNEVAVR